MFQVIRYNKDSEMFTIKDSMDNSYEDIDIDMLNKLESIGVSFNEIRSIHDFS